MVSTREFIGSLFLLGTLACLSVLFWATLKESAAISWNVDDYSHGLLLPFISLYFLWTGKDDITASIKQQRDSGSVPFSGSGLLLLFIGMGIFFVGEISQIHFIRWVAFFPALLGTLMLLVGTHVGLILGMPFMLVFMAKPLPDSLVPKLFFPLQVLAAKVSARILDIFDVPVFLKGNIIEIPGMQLMVEEACSGLRSMMALLTVALIVILSVRLSHWLKVLLVVVSIFTAIFLNVVRVAATGLLAHFYDPSAATGFFHTFSGMVVFIVGLIVLYQLAVILEKLTKTREKSNKGPAA